MDIKTLVRCPGCSSTKINNRFTDYDKETQRHLGFNCENCGDKFNVEEADFIEM